MQNNPLYAALREVCRFLDATGTRYTLVGGLAVGIWASPRATLDVDFLLSLSVQEQAISISMPFRNRGWKIRLPFQERQDALCLQP